MKLRSLAAAFALPVALAAHPLDADAQNKKQKPPAGSKLFKVKPPATLAQACPQTVNVQTTLVTSDYDIASASPKALKALGEIPYDDEGLLASIDELQKGATKEDSDKETYHITISSPGGSYRASMALAQAIVHYGAKHFTANAPAEAFSGAATILAAIGGKKYGMPSTKIMTHPTSLRVDGLPQDKAMMAASKLRRKNDDAFIQEFYRANLNITDECAKYLISNGDLYIDARQALGLGFLDALIRPRGMIEVRKGEEDRFLNFTIPMVPDEKSEKTGNYGIKSVYAINDYTF